MDLLLGCAFTENGSETTQHILQCTQSLSNIQPGGAGHASSIRVRLLHAAVRQRIMKLAHQRPEYYDANAWGIPINDLDCIATIGTFCATLIWISLPRQGIFLTQREITDYVALWRYIAYLTGTPTEHFETPEKARRIMEVLLLHEIKPTETSKVLANNIIKSLAGQPPSYASEAFLQVNSRWLNGNELSDALGIGRPGLYYWALALGQCLFFVAICYTYRAVPYLDRRKIAVSKEPYANDVHLLSKAIRLYARYFGKSLSRTKAAWAKKLHLTSSTSQISRTRPRWRMRWSLVQRMLGQRGGTCKHWRLDAFFLRLLDSLA